MTMNAETQKHAAETWNNARPESRLLSLALAANTTSVEHVFSVQRLGVMAAADWAILVPEEQEWVVAHTDFGYVYHYPEAVVR